MADSQRKLYALNLPTNSDKRVLESIFGTETIESLCTEHVRNPNGVNAVEILFKDENAAAQARADFADDGFQIDDDGENIRLLTVDEFEKYINQQMSENEPIHSAIPITPPSQIESEAVAVSPADSNGAQIEDETKPEAITDDEEERITNEENLPNKIAQSFGKWKPIPEYDVNDQDNNQLIGWEPVRFVQTTNWEDSAPENENTTWPDQQYESESRVDLSEITTEEVADRLTKYVEERRINWAEINDVSELWSFCDGVSGEYNGLPDSLLKEALLAVLESQITKHYNNWMRKHLQTLLRIWKMEVENESTQHRETKIVTEAAEYVPPPVRKRNTNAARRRLGKSLLGMGAFMEDLRSRLLTEEGELSIDEDDEQIYIGGHELSFETWGEMNRIKKDGAVRAEYIPALKKKRPNHNKHRPNIAGILPANPLNGENSEKGKIKKQQKLEEIKTKEIKKKEREEGEMSDSDDKSSASSSSSDESDFGTRNVKKRSHRIAKDANMAQPNMKSIFEQFYQHRFAIAHSLPVQQKANFLEVLRHTTTKMNPAQQQQMNHFIMTMMQSFMQTNQKIS